MPSMSVQMDSGTNKNICTKTVASADFSRYFNAWKQRAGPRDPATGQPNGNPTQYTRWCADYIQAQLDSFVTQAEATAVVPPPVDTVDS